MCCAVCPVTATWFSQITLSERATSTGMPRCRASPLPLPQGIMPSGVVVPMSPRAASCLPIRQQRVHRSGCIRDRRRTGHHGGAHRQHFPECSCTYSNAGTPTATSSSSDTSTRRIFQIRYINTAPDGIETARLLRSGDIVVDFALIDGLHCRLWREVYCQLAQADMVAVEMS